MVFAKEPSKDFLKEITKDPLHSILKGLGIEFDALFFEENAAEELGFEYVRVFIGVQGKHAAPYESVFSEVQHIMGKEKRQMYGEAAVAVRKMYIDAGYVPDKKFKDMPDHLAVELDFMNQLCRQEAAAKKDMLKEIEKKQIDFLKNHLLKWIDNFVKEVEEFATLEFYKSAAVVLTEFLKSDLQMLED